jgi:hypothetical protein
MLAAIRRAAEQVSRRTSSRFILEIDIGQRLLVMIADDETLPNRASGQAVGPLCGSAANATQ